MTPSPSSKLDISLDLVGDPLASSGFTSRLLASAARSLGATELRDSHLKRVAISVLSRDPHSQMSPNELGDAVLIFHLDLKQPRVVGGITVHQLALELSTREIPHNQYAALLKAAPGLAPGGVAARGDHNQVESCEALTLALPKNASMPASFRTFELQYPLPPQALRADSSFRAIAEALNSHCGAPLSFSCSPAMLPDELKRVLSWCAAPDGGGGTAFDYVERLVEKILLCSQLSTIGSDGCWRAVNSGMLYDKSAAGGSPKTGVLINLVRSERATQAGEPPCRIVRPVLEVVDSLVGVVAKIELQEKLRTASMPPARVTPREIELFSVLRRMKVMRALAGRYLSSGGTSAAMQAYFAVRLADIEQLAAQLSPDERKPERFD